MTPAGFRKLFSRLAVVAKILFPVHPHMLRHAWGYKLANDGRDTRAFFGVTKVPMGLTTALLDTERSAQCGDALLGRYVAHADRRQAGAAMSAEVPVNERDHPRFGTGAGAAGKFAHRSIWEGPKT